MLSLLRYCAIHLLVVTKSKCTVTIELTGLPLVKKWFNFPDVIFNSVKDNWNFIRNNLSKAIDTYIPVKFHSNRKDAPWMTSWLKRLMRKKNNDFITKPKDLNHQLIGLSTEVFKARYTILFMQNNLSKSTLLKYLIPNNLNHNKPFRQHVKSRKKDQLVLVYRHLMEKQPLLWKRLKL